SQTYRYESLDNVSGAKSAIPRNEAATMSIATTAFPSAAGLCSLPLNRHQAAKLYTAINTPKATTYPCRDPSRREVSAPEPPTPQRVVAIQNPARNCPSQLMMQSAPASVLQPQGASQDRLNRAAGATPREYEVQRISAKTLRTDAQAIAI